MNELYHHGIKGQKWGIRRFQNPDGTRTAAGKKRNTYAYKTKMYYDIPPRATSMKERRRMSGEELDRRISRLKKEKELKQLERDVRDEGKILASNVIRNSGQKVLTTMAIGGALYAGKQIITKYFGSEAASYVTPKPKNK